MIKREIRIFRFIIMFLVFFLFECTSFPEPELGDIEKVRLSLDQDSLKELNESEGSDDYTTCVYEDSNVKANNCFSNGISCHALNLPETGRSDLDKIRALPPRSITKSYRVQSHK